MKLTDLSIRQIKPPARGQKIYHDPLLTGFGIRVSLGGTKTFVLTYGNDRKRITLGRYPAISLAVAREKAQAFLRDHTLNDSPSFTFLEARTMFMELHYKQNRLSTVQEAQRIIIRHFSQFDNRKLADITTNDISTTIDQLLATPALANNAFTVIRTFFRWCVRRRYITQNPTDGLVKPAKPLSRDRVLSDPELASVLTTARPMGRFGVILEILALTGQRAGQIASLHSDFLTEDTITFPAILMKSAREHTIPLTSKVKSLLPERQGLLFPTRHGTAWNTWSAPKTDVADIVQIPQWTIHDLRRTFATIHARLGTPPHIVERLLAHSTGSISGVALIYNRYSYMDEMRTALLAYETHLASLLKN
jgi:integrase